MSGAQKGGGTLQARTPTHGVTGPTSWENGRDPVTVAGGASKSGAGAADVAPASPPCAGDCGPGGH